MANRRMFSKQVVHSSNFLMMPLSTQALYFHLGMSADDDGYVEHFPVMRMIDSKPDELKILQAKGLVHVFDDKVLVIRDWKENNYIQSDRYQASKYLTIFSVSKMDTKCIQAVSEADTRCIQENSTSNSKSTCIQDVSKMDTQDRIGKDRIYKRKEIKEKIADAPLSRSIFIPPTEEEIIEYGKMYFRDEFTVDEGMAFYDYFTSNGWKVGGKAQMKDWKAAFNNWHRRDMQFRKGGKK